MKTLKEYINEVDLFKASDDVESKLDKTLIKKIIAKIGKDKVNSLDADVNWWKLPDELNNILTKKLGVYSKGNFYKVSNKFLLKINKNDEWVVGSLK